MTWRIIQGDVLDRLREMPDESVQCCVTSPPYWGLRDYGVDGQIGLEASPEEHVAKLVEVFAEVRRVLRSDGVFWLNYGDAYAGAPNCGQGQGGIQATRAVGRSNVREGLVDKRVGSLKPKDLIGLPWMLAFALRADGWWLRRDIVWNKPNGMPENVDDRPSGSHEYVFLLSKSARYFYDRHAVLQPYADSTLPQRGRPYGRAATKDYGAAGAQDPAATKRRVIESMERNGGANLRDVWTIPTKPLREAHFASFPDTLPELCILAGTSARGACSKCGAPWGRIVGEAERAEGKSNGNVERKIGAEHIPGASHVGRGIPWTPTARDTVGWSPTCDCRGGGGTHGQPYAARPCIVLDPFAGAGTTLLVAERLGRDSIGIELNPEYVAIAERRIRARDPMAAVEVVPGAVQRSLWGERA